MDIDLLSKMVKELILDNDKVVLPGLGCFVAEVVPSTFSDKGYTINPPYRRLYFRSKPDRGSLLVDFYASSNRLEYAAAEHFIAEFMDGLKSVLHTRRMVVFPGLGRLRATKENNLFFVADEDLDIYPSGFGLEPVSLKNHEDTPEEVAAAVEGLASIFSQDAAVKVEEVQREDEAGAGLYDGEEAIDLDIDDSAPVVHAATQEAETVAETGVVAEAGVEADAEAVAETAEAADERMEVPEQDFGAVLETEEVSVEQVEGAENVTEVKVEEEAGPEMAAAGQEAVEASEPESETVAKTEAVIVPEQLDTETVAVAVAEAVTEHETVAVAETEEVAVDKVVLKRILTIVAAVLGGTVLLLALFVLLSRVAPDFVDRLLYSADELEILHYKL